MLHYLSFEVRSVTASFRNPEFQNFHKSFSLPPPTTLIGLAGAAMGFDPLKAQYFFEDNEIFAGVSGKSAGKANDLWKYNDFKNGSVILRELLFNNKLQITFASENEVIIGELLAAFQSPTYALTLGPSDSLAKIDHHFLIGTAEYTQGIPQGDSLVEGDVTVEAFEAATRNSKEFSFQINTQDAITVSLPTRFCYESAYGVRRVREKRIFSFVHNTSHLSKVARPGIQIGDQFFHLFKL